MIVCADITKAVIVRLFLVIHVFLCIWRVTVNLERQMYWLLLCILVPLVCESVFIIVRRKGKEISRFTPCFFLYLGAVLPGIWLLELDRSDLYIQGKDTTLVRPGDPTLPGQGQSIWLIVIEELMPYVIFISRWILPRGKLSREDLSEVLFVYIEIGADIMEFFSLLEEDVVRADKTLGYVVLSLWTLAILQFTMTLTIIYQPRSDKNATVVVVKSEKDKEWDVDKHQIFSIFMSLFMQDLPFSIMRMYIIVKFNRITYSLIFFISKNFLIIIMLLYKVGILCKKRHCPDPDEDNGDDKPEAIHGGGAHLSEIEKGRVRRKASFVGSLSHQIISHDNKGFNQHPLGGNLHSAVNQRPIGDESEVRIRNIKMEHSISTLIDTVKPPQGINGSIRSPSVHTPPKPHTIVEADTRVSLVPSASTSRLKNRLRSLASSILPRSDDETNSDAGSGYSTEPIVTHVNKPERNHSFRTTKPYRRLKDKHRRTADKVSLQSFDSQTSISSRGPSLYNHKDHNKSNHENFNHKPPKHKTPKHIQTQTSTKKPSHSSKDIQTQTNDRSPEQPRRNSRNPSRSRKDSRDTLRRHHSVPRRNSHYGSTASDDDVLGRYITRIRV